MKSAKKNIFLLIGLGLCGLSNQVAADPMDFKGIGKIRANRLNNPEIMGKATPPAVLARPVPNKSADGSAMRPPSVPVPPPAIPERPANVIAPNNAVAAANLEALLPGEKAATECVRLNANKKYKWDQRGEIDLMALLAWAQSSFCQPLIVPSTLRQQKVTIYAPNTMTPAEMYRMFLSALNAMGLTVQPQGPKDRPSALMIIETTRAKESAIPTVNAGEKAPMNNSFVTKVHRLEHLGTEEVMPILSHLKSAAGDLIAAPPSTLIITDVAENINRMMDILNQLDLPMGGEQIWLVKLVNVGSGEMADILNKVFTPRGGGQSSGTPVVRRAPAGGAPAPGASGEGGGGDQSVSQIIAEDRTNSLIIVASKRTYQRILGLIQRLDQMGGPLDTSADRVHVYFLANANSEDLAATLTTLGVSSSSRGATPRSTSPNSRTGASGGGAQVTSLFEGEVRVAPDKATNSLIIVASGKDYITIRDLIRKLDLARRQVFIEATILEVSIDKTRKLGMSFHFGSTVGSGSNQSLAFGGMEPNSSVNSVAFSPSSLSGLAAGLLGPAIPGAAAILGLPPGTSVPAFGVYVQALQNNNDVNVISLPHVLTSDNEKAIIEVGQNLPFPGSIGPTISTTGTQGTTGTAIGYGTSVQRQDVALKLSVTPHVNDGDFVRLEVDSEVQDVSSPNYNGLGPAASKRHVKTVVVVRDQQSVVLGGLIKDSATEAVDKVPFLGDIPILGYLFKYTNKSVIKQNLLIILTPYIIKDPQDLRRIFERKIKERKEFLERYSAFRDDNEYEPNVNYARKRGVLEEINRTGLEADQEAIELRRAEEQMRKSILQGPVEPASLSEIPALDKLTPAPAPASTPVPSAPDEPPQKPAVPPGAPPTDKVNDKTKLSADIPSSAPAPEGNE